MIQIERVNKIYNSKKRKQCHALHDITLHLPSHGLVFVLGKSGSGKSTLLNLIGGLDDITSGKIIVDGNDLSTFSEKEYCDYRNAHVGFIFQDYHLIDDLTVYDNIALALDLQQMDDTARIEQVLESVGLGKDYADRYPNELSGGERQRVAIARAIIKNPKIILADEPTGNLDEVTASSIIEILKRVSKECLILVVSHNLSDAYSFADRILELSNGRIICDKQRNHAFCENVTVEENQLLYPDKKMLSEEDIACINAHKDKPLVRRTDKYIPLQAEIEEPKQTDIPTKNLTLKKALKFCRRFLKSKMLSVAFSALFVAIITIILSLSQTIVAFDANKVMSDKMHELGETSFSVRKTINQEQYKALDAKGRAENFYSPISDEEIQSYITAGYEGTIYKVYNVYMPTMDSVNFHSPNGAFKDPISTDCLPKRTIGVLTVDEQFLQNKIGKVEYLAKLDEFHPAGVVITDYVADTILTKNALYKGKTYADLLGEYRYQSMKTAGYINGILRTDYKEKFANIFEYLKAHPIKDVYALGENEDFIPLSNAFYSYLAYAFSFNPHFEQAFLENYPYELAWHDKLYFNGKEFYSRDCAYVRNAEVQKLSYDLADNEIVMPYNKYNAIFGTKYTEKTLSSFVPHTISLQQYRYYDVGNQALLYETELKIVALVVSRTSPNVPTFFANENLINEFARNTIFVAGLYFDGIDQIETVIKQSSVLEHSKNSVLLDGIYTMMRAVEVFVPIFRLLSVFLYVGMICILINFATRMIRNKLHTIGIMKALGAKNYSLAIIFGLQIALIALLTCLFSSLGYLLFADVANDLLIHSLETLSPQRIIIELSVLTYNPLIAIDNCILIAVLSLLSLIAPLIRIKKIKPVKIIQTRE